MKKSQNRKPRKKKSPKEKKDLGKAIRGGKILGIPWSGVQLIDEITPFFDDSSTLDARAIMEYGQEFRRQCRSVARDRSSSSEEKAIWIRGAVNTLNACFSQAGDSSRVEELAATYFAIIEEEFMQLPDPICVKKIALEVEATEIMDSIVITLEGACSYNQFLLTEDLGKPALTLYQKKLCQDCSLKNCPYDYYWRMFKDSGEDNEKYSSLRPPEQHTVSSSSEDPAPYTLEQFKERLDKTCEHLGEQYVQKINLGELAWKFAEGRGRLLAYMCKRIALERGEEQAVPWKDIVNYIETSSGCDYLKTKAAEMFKTRKFPAGYETVDAALEASRQE